jgi:hypothetical protein
VDRQCTNDGDQRKLRCTSTVLLHQEPDSNSGRVDKVSSVHIPFDFASIRQKGPYESEFSGFAVGYPARSSNLVIDACVLRLTTRPPKKKSWTPRTSLTGVPPNPKTSERLPTMNKRCQEGFRPICQRRWTTAARCPSTPGRPRCTMVGKVRAFLHASIHPDRQNAEPRVLVLERLFSIQKLAC